MHTCVVQGGSFATLDLPLKGELDYFFLHGINSALIAVGRAKVVGDVPRTYAGNPVALQELKFPGSVSTEGWNVNQDNSIVGHYDSADGRRHGFIARPKEVLPKHAPVLCLPHSTILLRVLMFPV